jgi:hypothetical protein
MSIAKRKLTALSATACLVLAGLQAAPALPAADSNGHDRLTKATTVVLDFRDQPVSEVIKAIGERSGKRVSDRATPAKGFVGVRNDDWRDRPVTIEAPRAVPFWEAIDRLAEEGHVRYRLASGGDPTGSDTTVVVFEGPGDAPSLARYAGPFRVGLLSVHEHREVVFIRGPWVQVFPSGDSVATDAAGLGAAPLDGGPLYAELQMAAEPGLICRRNGPLTGLEAVDEQGRSLLARALENSKHSFAAFEVFAAGTSPALRVPLRRLDGPSKSIARLRGAIPVDVAVLKTEPALVIPLKDAEGKTFRGGGASFTVKVARSEANGVMRLAFEGELEGVVEPVLRSSRITTLVNFQYRVVDAQGAPVHFGSSSRGGGPRGDFSLTFVYDPTNSRGTGPPAEFRFYDLDRTTWEVPFEFRDLPLP